MENETEQNIVRVTFTDIDGNIFDKNQKTGEYLNIKTNDGLLALERVQEDGSASRFEHKGDIISQSKQGNQQIYWANNHHGDGTYKFIVFGINEENKTVDSLFMDFGEDYHEPKIRLTKFYGDLRWNQ